MFATRLKQFFGSPALSFAFGVCLFYGNDGGLRLQIATLFLTFIIACQIARVIGVPPGSKIRAVLVRPSVQQFLVAALCGLIALVTLLSKPLHQLVQRDLLFMGVAFFGVISNVCTARLIERGFARTSNLTLAGILLVPQVWGLMSSGMSVIYNGGLTPYLSLPLLVIAAWCGVVGRVGPYLVNAGMPFYCSVVHNIWYAFCNATGAHPNKLIIISCIASGLGSLLLARMANSLGGTANIPPAEMAYIEIPGLVYRAPRMALADDLGFMPCSFRV